MDIRTVATGDDVARWDRYVESHPAATFFHLSGWRRVIERTFGYRPVYAIAEEGEEVRGVLPLFDVRSLLFGRSLVSVPLGVYGGACASDAGALTALVDHATRQAEALGVGYLELRHREPAPGRLAQRDLYVTFEREIDPEPDRNMAAIPRNQRRSIRQGQKAGLESRLGGLEHLSAFYDVYAHSVRNLGTPVYPRRLFEQLLHEFGEACRILTVWRGGEMLAGVMTFFFRDRVMPYYGGALRAGFRYAVNDFMYWELMCYAAGRGLRVFDFGRSKRDSGSYHFKRHWGFQPAALAYQYHLVRQRRLPDTSPTNPRFAAAIRLWRRLPLPVTKLIGPWIARSIP